MSHGKRDIGVRAIEVRLYIFLNTVLRQGTKISYAHQFKYVKV